MLCGAFSLEENKVLGFGRSLLHKLGYPNPSVWCKLGFLNLAFPTLYLCSLARQVRVSNLNFSYKLL